MEKLPLIVLVGPTASGKTALAVELCKEINGEVVTADSMQVYKDMNIGTAKPDKAEMQGIKHHMIDIVEPDENYSLAQYVLDAKECIKDIASRGKIPVLAGGTGLYVDTLTQNIMLSEGDTDFEYREELLSRSEKEGNEVLLKELYEIDAETAERLHLNDTKRIVRALEVYKATGITQSEHIRRSKQAETPYNTVKFCITGDRDELYRRINLRVDKMFENGLKEEAESLFRRGIDEKYTSMQGIGYKEIFGFFRNQVPLEFCIDQIKQNTRRYAKRQISWFKRDENQVLIDMSSEKKMEMLKKHIDLSQIL